MATAQAVNIRGVRDCWNRIGVRGDRSCPELDQYVHCRNCPVYTEAAANLLDSAAPPEYLADWTVHCARPRNVAERETRNFFIFRLGPEWLAFPVDLLHEVAPLGAIHSLPHRSQGAVMGVTNVRGQLLVCLSLQRILGLREEPVDRVAKRLELRRLLVIRDDGGALAFPVDEAHGVVSCPEAELAEVPATVAGAASAFTRAIFSWEDRSVGCLDRELTMTAVARSLK